jgi:TetR/AcrR family transcriptional regulator
VIVDKDATASPGAWAAGVRDMKRVAILAAAGEVFGEHGLEGASMRQIAQRAGCTTGAIYPLFESKERIYAELLATSLADLHAHVAAARAGTGKGLPHERAAQAFLDHYLARPYEVNLGLYAFNGLKKRGVGKAGNDTLNAALTDTLVLLSPSGRRGRHGAPDADAMSTFAQLIGTLVLHQAGRLQVSKFSPRQLIEHALTTRRRAAGQQET